ncbi:MAG: imidazolonepropionase [Candidatus Glassbacteria bacterium]
MEKESIDLLITNVGELLTMSGGLGPRGGKDMAEVGLVKGASLSIRNGTIFSCGSEDYVLRGVEGHTVSENIDAGGRLLTPGFIDPHTHTVFAGRREGEFEMKVGGVSYQEIARSGGGILETVRQVRKASVDELVSLTLPRLDIMLSHGTTTAEVKSGYGLTTDDEIKMLEVIRRLNEIHPIELIPTFLGAHEFPPEYQNRRDEYVDLVVDEMLPAVASLGLARFCDVFCEMGWFDQKQSRRILTRAKQLGFDLRIHADEFKPSGAAELAAELGALSADHLVMVSEEGMSAMKEAGVVATLLPGTVFFLDLDERPPVGRMKELGLPIALASDFNPGSSMTQNMQIIMSIAAIILKLTPAECFTASTVNAAHSLGIAKEVGSIEVGKSADLVIFDADDHRSIAYNFGVNHCNTVIKKGKVVYKAD